jgi:hypothetical protein
VEQFVSDGGKDKPAAPGNPYAERDARRLFEKLKEIENLMTWWRLGSPGREPTDPKFREMQRERERIILELKEGAKPAAPKSGRVQRRKRRVFKKTPSRSLASTIKAPDVEPANRKAAVNDFIERVREETGYKAKRKDIWTVLGYRVSTEFERWQRNDPRTTKTATDKFNRILKIKPKDFVEMLKRPVK